MSVVNPGRQPIMSITVKMDRSLKECARRLVMVVDVTADAIFTINTLTVAAAISF